MPDKPRPGLILDVLPVEVLGDIFKLCLPRSRFIRPRPEEAPMLLTQICQQWRTICLNTPDFWSCLRIPEGDTEGELSKAKDLVETWLLRSGDYPLSIWCPQTAFDHAPINKLLVGACSRWKDIRIDMLPQTQPIPQDSQFPMLETLEILTPFGLPSPNPLDSISPFASSPKLRKFVWIDPTKCEYEGGLRLRWAQLTHLTMSVEMPLLHCLNILSRTTSLVQAAFQSINMRLSGDASLDLAPPMIDLPNLETFSLLSATSFEPLLERLTAPKLTELIINLYNGRQHWPWPAYAFLTFLERSQCPLEILSLYFNNVSPSDLIAVLQPIQFTLKALTLQGERSPFTATIAELLTPIPGVKTLVPLCPKLEFLGLFDCIDCCPESLHGFVRSRSDTSSAPPGDPLYVARLKVVECFEKDASLILSGFSGLKQTPVLLRYDRGSVLPAGLNPKESLKLKRLKEQGFHFPRYSAGTGQLGPIDDWYIA